MDVLPLQTRLSICSDCKVFRIENLQFDRNIGEIKELDCRGQVTRDPVKCDRIQTFNAALLLFGVWVGPNRMFGNKKWHPCRNGSASTSSIFGTEPTEKKMFYCVRQWYDVSEKIRIRNIVRHPSATYAHHVWHYSSGYMLAL